jgi:CBS domain-containing protein
MKSEVISVTPDAPVAGAARLMTQYNIGSLPVCSPDGKLRGLITDRDIVTRCVAAEEDASKLTVREIMTRSVTCISADDDPRSAAKLMSQKQIRRLPVTENDGTVKGMLSLADLARSAKCEMEAAEALREISENTAVIIPDV